jgi:UMF1 family MFS transporter
LMVLIGVGVQLAVGNTAENQNLGDRLAISIGGVWWAAWSVWTILYLKPHPGKALPAGEWLLTKGWVSTAATLRQAASFPETFKFLIAYFLYSDSYSTIGYLGVLVMQQQMCLPSFLVGIVLLEVLAFAVAGNILSLRIQYHFNAQPKQMIFLALSGYVLLCGLGLLGLIPGSPIGLKTVPEAFIFGAVHGMMLGPVQSYSRTLFSDLVIPGKEAEFFALFEITDKGSSWLGPLVVGEVYRVTRSINAGFVYLMAMTAFPALLLLTVDHRKGMRQVRLLASQQRGDRPLMPHPHAAFEDAPSADSESRELEEPAGESLATHGRDDSPRAEAAGGGARSGRGGGDAGGLEGAGLAQHKGPG